MIQSCKLSTAFEIAEIDTNIVESNSPSELLTPAAVGNLFTRCQSGTQTYPIRDDSLSRSKRRSVAPL